MSHDAYAPFTREELHQEVGGTEEEFTEALAGLIEKGVILEHHDGGYTFNALAVGALLAQHGEHPDDDVWLG